MNTSFWTFSVSLYSQPGVAQECLLLQDHFGINVNVLLLCLYAGSEYGAALSSDDIDAAYRAITAWDTQAVKPLRELRRLLKYPGTRGEWPRARDTELLNTWIREAELESERIETAMLQEWLENRLSDCARGARQTAVAGNLHRVLTRHGAEKRSESLRHLHDPALAGHC